MICVRWNALSRYYVIIVRIIKWIITPLHESIYKSSGYCCIINMLRTDILRESLSFQVRWIQKIEGQIIETVLYERDRPPVNIRREKRRDKKKREHSRFDMPNYQDCPFG